MALTSIFSADEWRAGLEPPAGWDCADAIRDGWTGDDLGEVIDAARPWSPPSGEVPVGVEPAETRSQPAALAGPRPVIKYVDSELPHVVSLACDAAVSEGLALYARGTSLVRPVTLPARSGKGLTRTAGSTILAPVERAGLVEMLTRAIDWRKWDGRKEDFKPCSCPSVVADTILARRGDWPFPQLQAVISAPLLWPDGEIMNKPGFDAETGILFASTHKWPKVPEQPSKEAAAAAMGSLRDLLADFPFVGPSDRSAALALILTAIIRAGLPSAPLFGVSAPTPGTGKSKLVDIASILATGLPAAVLSAPKEEAELQKQVGAALMAGDALVSLDNVEHPLRSEFLCQVLTQSEVNVRVLGESRNAKLPTRALFCATGNALRFAGDLTRRVVLINLDAHVERPEERVFTVDAVEVARTRRVPLVTAALTVLRAFIVHRGAKVVPALGSFECWSNLVRSTLVWLGEADPLANSGQVREADPERERTAAILAALPADRAWTVAEIGRRIAMPHEPLAEALSEFVGRGGQFEARAFGYFLRKHVGRIIDGRCIARRGVATDNAVMWIIEDSRQEW